MPIYEYKCLECSAQVEKMQKVSDEPLKTCEVCGGKLEKQWSLSGIQFKGAGWYVTDYSSKLKETGADKAEKAETPGESAKPDKTGKADKAEKTEKTSVSESTVKTETASNKSNDNASSSKAGATSKKD